MEYLKTILQALDLIVEHGIWPDKKPSEIINILLFAHNKGWLYMPTVDGKITAVICAYRISDVTDETLTKLPITEEGNILYIPFVVSIEKDKNLFHIIRASCNIYLENNPDITEIVVEDKNNKIKRFKIDKK